MSSLLTSAGGGAINCGGLQCSGCATAGPAANAAIANATVTVIVTVTANHANRSRRRPFTAPMPIRRPFYWLPISAANPIAPADGAPVARRLRLIYTSDCSVRGPRISLVVSRPS